MLTGGIWAMEYSPIFGNNYSRRFQDTDLFEKIFSRILSEVAANGFGFLDTENRFIDDTHIKASANSHKYHNEVIRKEARSYEKELPEEIKRERQEHKKKPLKEKKEPKIGNKMVRGHDIANRFVYRLTNQFI